MKEKLRETNAFLQNILDSSSSISIISTDLERNILYWNVGAENIFGYSPEEIVGRQKIDILYDYEDECTKKFIENIRTSLINNKKGISCDVREITKDGRKLWINMTLTPRFDNIGNVIGILGIGKDINDRKNALEELMMNREHLENLVKERTIELTAANKKLLQDILKRREAEEENIKLEKKLQQAKKMEAVGTLAAGIAHEINTPIQFIGDNTRFLSDVINSLTGLIGNYKDLLKECGLGEKVSAVIKKGLEAEREVDLQYLEEEIPKAIAQTQEGLNHVTKIINAMKNFSRMDTEEKAKVDINKAIESTVTVSRNEWKYVADVKTDLDPALPLVSCFLGDINQVVMNLIVNAAHAIADSVGGRGKAKGLITITTRREADNVIITVSDTGTGISEDIRDKIFEQFFTTKDVGKGTGQGLSMAYAAIVEKHGGKLTFDTEIGKGTTFVIELSLREKYRAEKLPGGS